MHDRIAELAGLRAELVNCETGPRESRRDKAGEVRAEIDRVRGELAAKAEALEVEAEELTERGQDGVAGQVVVEARQIRALLAEDEGAGDAPTKARAAGTSGKRNTAAAKAPEQT